MIAQGLIDPLTEKPYVVEGPLKVGQERSELLSLSGIGVKAKSKTQPQIQLVMGPDGQLVQTTLNLQPTSSNRKSEFQMTPEERARIERNRLIKQ